MNITLRQITVFQAVARHLNYTLAADDLHVTQPAVSMQVKQLEDTLELPLFEQVGKRIYLTEAGRELYRSSRRITESLDEAIDVIQSLKGVRGGLLKLSVATTANHFATRLLAGFVERYPGVSFSLDVTNRETLLSQLANNERDLVIMGQPPATADLLAVPFLRNPLVMIAPPSHPLVGQRQIPLERLVDACFVLREPGSGTRSAAERFFAEHDLVLSPGMEMSSNEAIKQAVEASLGLAVVSLHTLEVELQVHRLAILDVQGFPIERHWFLAQRHGKRLSPVAAAFREFVLGEAKTYVSLPVQEMYRETQATTG